MRRTDTQEQPKREQRHHDGGRPRGDHQHREQDDRAPVRSRPGGVSHATIQPVAWCEPLGAVVLTTRQELGRVGIDVRLRAQHPADRLRDRREQRSEPPCHDAQDPHGAPSSDRPAVSDSSRHTVRGRPCPRQGRQTLGPVVDRRRA
ncbi:hypothetical protein CURTO8I2_80122 [Curtobacterium sp. 8I-2]|nr:hypothetical protein CURTO8I2_80122 [Curtobacterium sp. 8I-2]